MIVEGVRIEKHAFGSFEVNAVSPVAEFPHDIRELERTNQVQAKERIDSHFVQTVFINLRDS